MDLACTRCEEDFPKGELSVCAVCGKCICIRCIWVHYEGHEDLYQKYGAGRGEAFYRECEVNEEEIPDEDE